MAGVLWVGGNSSSGVITGPGPALGHKWVLRFISGDIASDSSEETWYGIVRTGVVHPVFNRYGVAGLMVYTWEGWQVLEYGDNLAMYHSKPNGSHFWMSGLDITL